MTHTYTQKRRRRINEFDVASLKIKWIICCECWHRIIFTSHPLSYIFSSFCFFISIICLLFSIPLKIFFQLFGLLFFFFKFLKLVTKTIVKSNMAIITVFSFNKRWKNVQFTLILILKRKREKKQYQRLWRIFLPLLLKKVLFLFFGFCFQKNNDKYTWEKSLFFPSTIKKKTVLLFDFFLQTFVSFWSQLWCMFQVPTHCISPLIFFLDDCGFRRNVKYFSYE